MVVFHPPNTMPPTSGPDFERTHCPWGWFETVSVSPGTKVKRIGVLPGHRISLQKHHHRSEHWVVTAGCAQVTLGEQTFALSVGQHCDIALGQVHRLTNLGADPVEIIEVQFGAYLAEDDIVRLGDDYGRS